jgi:2,4-dienoyl-CoA reductase-like NADH-dependent reductase (Old Yellow Enzyme family)
VTYAKRRRDQLITSSRGVSHAPARPASGALKLDAHTRTAPGAIRHPCQRAAPGLLATYETLRGIFRMAARSWSPRRLACSLCVMTASSDPALARLLSPVHLGALQLRNRLVMAPMTRSQSPGHVPNPRNVEYYRRRAAGGVGLVITEGTTVGHPAASGYPDVPAFDGAEALAGWKAVADAVHSAGAAIMPQLWHVGSVRQAGTEPDGSIPGYAPSAVVHPGAGEGAGAPREMTEQDMGDVINAFARSAASAKRLGFDGVEIHGAHGYLIDQFFWTKTNRRTDAHGGSLTNRTRFAAQLVRAVRESVGSNFPVALRISQFKLGDFDYKVANDPKELETWLSPLVEAGVDLFHCSQRRFDEPAFEGSPLNLAGWVKHVTGKPTLTVGSIGLNSDFVSSFGGQPAGVVGIERLLERLGNDEFDLVTVGRALLADPEWPEKLRSGRYADVVSFLPEHLQRYP